MNKSKIKEVIITHIQDSLTRLITPSSPGGKKSPVDCVAFDAITSVDNAGRVNGYRHVSCLHPNRERQFGCLLTQEDATSNVKRKRRAQCQWQIKKGTHGAAALTTRIEDETMKAAWH